MRNSFAKLAAQHELEFLLASETCGQSELELAILRMRRGARV